MTVGQFISRAEWAHRQRHGYYCTDPHGALQLMNLYKWMLRSTPAEQS